jgi:hypothetical protein
MGTYQYIPLFQDSTAIFLEGPYDILQVHDKQHEVSVVTNDLAMHLFATFRSESSTNDSYPLASLTPAFPHISLETRRSSGLAA